MEERLKVDIANDMLCTVQLSSEAVYRLHRKNSMSRKPSFILDRRGSGRGYGYFQIFGKTEDASRFEEK